MDRRSLAVAVIFSMAFGASRSIVQGQCPVSWRVGAGSPGVDSVPITAMTEWDPDGAGPEPSLLVAAGSFSVAGDIAANCVASWDGRTWMALGGGLNLTVDALGIYNGELIAGGLFTAAGSIVANRIAR